MTTEIIEHELPETKEVQVQDNSPAAMMMAAINGKMDLDKLEKFLQLQIKWEEREAMKAYVADMARFKADPPEILKTAHVEYGEGSKRVSWDHAELGIICEQIIEGLSKYGFYHRWDKRKAEGLIYVKCIITHKLGHYESVEDFGPPDTSGGKDALKADASTTIFLQRYTLLAAVGLAAKNMDKETPPDPTGVITEAQAIALDKLLTESGADAAKFLDYFDIGKIQDLKVDKHKEAETFLKAKVINKKKA